MYRCKYWYTNWVTVADKTSNRGDFRYLMKLAERGYHFMCKRYLTSVRQRTVFPVTQEEGASRWISATRCASKRNEWEPQLACVTSTVCYSTSKIKITLHNYRYFGHSSAIRIIGLMQRKSGGTRGRNKINEENSSILKESIAGPNRQ